MATITAAAGGGVWTTGATWVGGIAPTSNDDVVFDASSGSVTVAANAFCRSLNCSGYTATLTHNASSIIFIGAATPGTSNIALMFSAGMTYTYGSSATSQIAFVASTATQQTITTAGKTLPLVNWNGPGGSWILSDSLTAPATIIVQAGTLSTNGQTVTVQALACSYATTRSLMLGASNITLTTGAGAWDTSIITGLTFDAGTSTLTFTGTNAFMGSSVLTFNNVVFSGIGTASTPTVGCTYTNLTRTGTAAKTDILALRASCTVTGTFTANGNSVTNRLLVQSTPTAASAGGAQHTITAAAVAVSNTDFMDVIGAGAAAWDLSAITGGSGNCGGTRVPLPQDDVFISSVFAASQTLTMDMPRSGRSIDFTGSSGGLTLNPSTATTIFGSLNLTDLPAMGSSSAAWTFGGRGAYTLTFAGFSLTKAITILAPGGTYTLQDALTTTGAFSVTSGTFISNSITLNVATFTSINNTSVAAIGTSTINLTSTAASFIFLATNNGTISAGVATINIVNASANNRSIACGSALTNGTFNYTVAGSTGSLLFGASSITIQTFNFSDSVNARTLTFTVGVVHTFTNFNVSGAAGRVITINSSAPGTAATIRKTSGYVECDYLSIQDSAATGGASWYAGVNATNVSNNTGWFFTPAYRGTFLEFL